MESLVTRSTHTCFGGIQGYYQHDSRIIGLPMGFSVYQPPQAQRSLVPVLFFLAGLTCTEETFMIKAGAQRLAAEYGLMLVTMDTSPRQTGIPGEADRWDFGAGAGFYLNATQQPWSKYFRMESYITQELYNVILTQFPADKNRIGIFGHSMGGHGALTLALRNPGFYQSVSAFAPIANPIQSPWGEKAFSHYLGEKNRESWRGYDATALIEDGYHLPTPLIDQGLNDEFFAELHLDHFEVACRAAGQSVMLRYHKGYNHGYYFVSTFIADHLAYHRDLLSK